jgi:hypothetical protein
MLQGSMVNYFTLNILIYLYMTVEKIHIRKDHDGKVKCTES